MSAARYTRHFAEIGAGDVPLVGGKNASLGEMYANLAESGVLVPEGFAVTAEAYRATLAAAGAWPLLRKALAGVDVADVTGLAAQAAAARDIVRRAALPPAVAEQIAAAYDLLCRAHGSSVPVAVRSSATAEDLPSASFAGQHESYLDVRGTADLLAACRRCYASAFTDRAVHYRAERGFDHFDIAVSIGIMRMVRSDLSASGVMFTLDTESGFPGVVFVTGSYGLGENVVQGAVEPDEFYVHKATYEAGHRCVLRRRRGSKALTMVLGEGGSARPRNVDTPDTDRARFCITDDDVLELAGHALAIERHYGRAMDIEWAKDGVDGSLYIVQARPETSGSRRPSASVETCHVLDHGEQIATGRAVGAGAASGKARPVRDVAELAEFRPGEVLVAETTTPDWEPVLKLASAVVTERGGRTCHAAIIARELGIPAVVGAADALRLIRPAEQVTVSCAEGETGRVFRGAALIRRDTVDVAGLPRPRTAVMVNIGNPDLAFRTALLPNDGVGLARMEFVISTAVQAHPMALLHPERVTDPGDRASLRELTAGHPDGASFFVERLSEGIGTIAAAFHPRPVVVRMSDFKTNEYAALLGGAAFEPHEENPMLGFRGASRYAHPAYAEGFALECRAMRRVREEMGLTNVVLMLPFVRRLAEADLVLARMAELGLRRGENGLKIYAMCEIPNNVVLVDEFAKRFDGFSIGTNDLTQLALGVDRDCAAVSFDYDERDPGVKQLIRLAVEGCHRNGIHVGLCGQAPSDHPDMAEFLVEVGIDAISLTPDSLVRTTAVVLEAERARQG